MNDAPFADLLLRNSPIATKAQGSACAGLTATTLAKLRAFGSGPTLLAMETAPSPHMASLYPKKRLNASVRQTCRSLADSARRTPLAPSVARHNADSRAT